MNYDHIISTDGDVYINVDDVREALGIVDEYVDAFGVIKKLKEERDNLKDNLRITENALKTVKQERDVLKDKVDRMKKRTNAAYGVSCGYSGDKAPAFLCDVISYSWEFGPIAPCSLMDEPSYRVNNDTIRVELNLTATANYKGTFDLEDLKNYIQEYGREKKRGIVESVDYQNAKAARADLAYLYKQVLGKEKLDRDLSSHEVMKAILDEYKRVRDSQFAFSQCLRSVYMHVCNGPDYKVSDIYAAPDKLADEIITRYNSARMLSRLETLKEIDDHIDELCDKHNVVQPDRKSTTKERLDYIFAVLADYRELADNNFNKAEGFRKEKRAAENPRRDFLRELSCSLGFGDPFVTPDNIDQKEKDILERVEKLKGGVWPCENSSTFAEYLRKEFPKFCERYNVTPLNCTYPRGGSVHDWIQYIFGVLADYRTLANNNFNKAEGFRKEKRAAEDSLSELRAKIREIHRSVVDDEWNNLSYTSALNDINEEYKRVVHNFEERTADWSKAQQELDRYRLAVGSLLSIPNEARDDINAIERSFTFSKKKYESLQEFRNDVCEMFDIPSSMADNYILKEIHDVVDRYNELEDFRADICGALDIEGMLGTPKQNDKYILEQVEKLRKGNEDAKQFRIDIRKALCVYGEASHQEIITKAREVFDRRNELIYFKGDVAKAAGLSCDTEEYIILESVKALKGYSDAVEQGADKAIYAVDRDEYDKQKELADRLARLRSNICTALCLGHEDCDGNIIGRIHMMQDCHEKLCKDYTELRKAIWDAMDRKPETLPEETARLVGEVRMLQLNYVGLKQMHDEVAKAIGMDYPVTDNDIINRVKSLYDANESNHDVISDLNRQVTELKQG